MSFFMRRLAQFTDEERTSVWEEATAKAEEAGRKLTEKAVRDAPRARWTTTCLQHDFVGRC